MIAPHATTRTARRLARARDLDIHELGLLQGLIGYPTIGEDGLVARGTGELR